MNDSADTARNEPRCGYCEYLKSGLKLVYSLIAKIYVYVFGRPATQPINDIILQLALRGRGYNNCCDPKTSGEAIFIDLLSKNNPRLCIDIGANIGLYSETLLRKTNAQIVAFEPLPKAFDKLLKLKELYPNRLDAVNVGVGEKDGSLDLFYGAEDSTLASFSEDEIGRAHV